MIRLVVRYGWYQWWHLVISICVFKKEWDILGMFVLNMSCAHLRTVNLIRDLAVSMEKLFRLLEEKKTGHEKRIPDEYQVSLSTLIMWGLHSLNSPLNQVPAVTSDDNQAWPCTGYRMSLLLTEQLGYCTVTEIDGCKLRALRHRMTDMVWLWTESKKKYNGIQTPPYGTHYHIRDDRSDHQIVNCKR